MAIQVVGVPSIGVEKIWPQVEPLIAPSLKWANGCFLPVDLRDACMDTRMQLWIVLDAASREIIAAVVTRISVYPRRKALSVPFGGGRRMREWLPLLNETIEGFARHMGCSFMEGGARTGWVRAAGYRNIGAMLIKEL